MATAPITPPNRFPHPPPAIPGNVYDQTTEPRPGPTWYGKEIAREDRPWYTATGDVKLVAGRTFPEAFPTFKEAFLHSKERSQAEDGAVAVLEDNGQFYLSRLYNAEHSFKDGLHMERTQAGRSRSISRVNPEARAITDVVDGKPFVRWSKWNVSTQ
jgi:hypothetical protein